MDPKNIIWIKQEEREDVPTKPLSISCKAAAMAPENTIWIKQEETEEVPTEPVPTCCKTAAMASENIIWIKQEETEELPTEPVPTLLEDPLGDFINEDPELSSGVDETEKFVAISTRYAFSSTRLIQNTGESCGISLEETANKVVVHDELEKGPEESTHLTMFGTHAQGLISQEDSLFGNRLKCSLRKKEFHPFSCSFCLQTFTSKYSLIMHVFIHIDGVQPPIYVCKSCGEVFSNNVSLNKHLKMNEANQVVSSGGNEILDCSDSTTVLPTAKSPHKCHVCGKSFGLFKTLKTHALVHTGKRPHKCDICGKTFGQLGHLKSHAVTHTGKKPYKCDICSKTFTQVGTLRRHALIHTGMRPHKCDICGKSFSQMSTLKSHALLHTGKRPYKCDVCGKSFTELRHLTFHALIHAGKRLHKCDICSRSFTLMSNLKRHEETHTMKKQRKCDISGK